MPVPFIIDQAVTYSDVFTTPPDPLLQMILDETIVTEGSSKEFEEAEANVKKQINHFIQNNGSKSVDYFHKKFIKHEKNHLIYTLLRFSTSRANLKSWHHRY